MNEHPASRERGDARPVATQIVRRLRAAGHDAYFAGGCVRDELLGLTPKDYDIATAARPDQVQRLFRRTQAVGASFGVVQVRERGAHGGAITVEVATFRTDGVYRDHRRPEGVAFSDARHDAQRRDFTVNALFLDPLGEPSPPSAGGLAPVQGVVIDYVGGLADLRAGVLRAVGDPAARLAEDHLRALRAARFAARLSLSVDPATAEAVRAHASALAGVSRERVGDEVRKILTHQNRVRGAELLVDLGLAAEVFGWTGSAAVPPEQVRSQGFGHVAALGNQFGADPSHGLAALAMDLFEHPETVVSSWRGRLCLSNDERTHLEAVLGGVRRLLAEFSGASVAVQKRMAASSWFDVALRLVGVRHLGAQALIASRVEELGRTATGIRPAAWLDGAGLIRLGYAPGPAFGRVLEGVYDAQLEGVVLDRVGAERRARELFATLGVEPVANGPG